MPTPPPAIALTEVTCQFGRIRALDQLSLAVPAGTVGGIVGPNGAGKTTVIDLVSGLLRPDTGRVTVLGEDVRRRAQAVRRQIGVVPQETALYEELTPGQNLQFAAALYGVPNPARRIAELLKMVGLTGRAQDAVRTLSGGMQRRLSSMRALLHDPAVLLLDEPTLGVDMEARHQIWAHIRGLRAQGRTILLTTNYLDEAEALCDRVAILRAGKLLAEDTPAALVAQAGRCIELECPKDAAARLEVTLRQEPGVLRTQVNGTGLTVYLNGHRAPEDLVQQARVIAPLAGFRTRSPDLAEVFKALAVERAA